MTGIKELVTIQRPDLTADDYGTGTRAWTDIVELKAVFTTVGAGELLRMDRTQMDFTHMLYIDYHKARTIEDINPECRVKIGDLYYDIVSIEHHMRRMTVLALRLTV